MEFQSLLNQGFDRDITDTPPLDAWTLDGFQSLLNQGFDRDARRDAAGKIVKDATVSIPS